MMNYAADTFMRVLLPMNMLSCTPLMLLVKQKAISYGEMLANQKSADKNQNCGVEKIGLQDLLTFKLNAYK